jgi:arginase
MSVESGRPLNGLHVVGVRYRGSRPAQGDERALDSYSASGVYERAGVPVTVAEPRFDEELRLPSDPDNLGLIGGKIAEEVAAARKSGKAVIMTGGDCSHITGVLGGLQDAHGAGARVGLIWFDAHGDFNTPKTTLSGMLGGMPVAVCAGLAYPFWREQSHIQSPLPTERIVMVDVRNLDRPEEQLIRATDVQIARVAPGFTGDLELGEAIEALARRCDYLYLHIDSDILDERYVPNHGTREPNGPDMAQVHAAIETVMATGKVAAYAVVSIYGAGEGADISRASGIELIAGGLDSWRRHGMAV